MVEMPVREFSFLEQSFQTGQFKDVLIPGTLGLLQDQDSTGLLPNPTDDTPLEFYFEQPGNIQRSFREGKSRRKHHRAS